MLMMSEKLDKILPALVQVKANVKSLVKKSDNPFFKSKYVDLNTHLDEVEPLLEQFGLVLFQPPLVTLNGGNTVTTIIFHGESGQYFGANIAIPSGLDAQKTGASITYFRRFGLNALLALKSIDDDGEEAVGRSRTTAKSASVESKPQLTTSASVIPAQDKAPRTGFRDRLKKTAAATTTPAATSSSEDI